MAARKRTVRPARDGDEHRPREPSIRSLVVDEVNQPDSRWAVILEQLRAPQERTFEDLRSHRRVGRQAKAGGGDDHSLVVGHDRSEVGTEKLC